MSDLEQQLQAEAQARSEEALVKVAEAESDKQLVKLSKANPNTIALFRYGLAAWIVYHFAAWITL